MEFGEKVHHRHNVKGENARNKMDGRWHEDYYLGTDWMEDRVGLDENMGWSRQGDRDPQDRSFWKVGPGRRVGCARHALEQGARCGGRIQ